MKIARMLLLLLCVGPGCIDPGGDDDDAAPQFDAELGVALTTTLQEQHALFGPPGLVAAVQMPDGTSWLSAVGAESIDGAPLFGNEFFKVASVTKSLVAGLVMRLVDEDLLTLEATIEPWIDHPRADEITVWMLLNHSAAVPDFSRTPAFQNNGARDYEDAELIELVAAEPLGAEPGTTHLYSNTHYVMLTMIVEAVTLGPWQNRLNDTVLAPLGLEATYVPDGTAGWGDVVRGYLGGTDLTDSIRPSGIGGAGNAVSTALDMARWARGFWGTELLSEDARAELTEGALPLSGSVSYGLGTIVVDDDRGLQLAHNGALNGYVAWVGYRPDRDIGLAVLANAWLPGNPPGVSYSTDVADALWEDVLDAVP